MSSSAILSVANTEVGLRGVFLALVAFFGALGTIAGLLWYYEAGDALFRQPLLKYSGICFVLSLAGFVVTATHTGTTTRTSLFNVVAILFEVFAAATLIPLGMMTVIGNYDFKCTLGVAMAHSAWISFFLLMTLGGLAVQRRMCDGPQL